MDKTEELSALAEQHTNVGEKLEERGSEVDQLTLELSALTQKYQHTTSEYEQLQTTFHAGVRDNGHSPITVINAIKKF